MSSESRYVIEGEHTIARLTRSETDELRVTRARGTFNGRPFTNTSLRIYYRDAEGEWRPTKKGLSVRDHELKAVCTALGKVLAKVDSSEPDEDDDRYSEEFPW